MFLVYVLAFFKKTVKIMERAARRINRYAIELWFSFALSAGRYK